MVPRSRPARGAAAEVPWFGGCGRGRRRRWRRSRCSWPTPRSSWRITGKHTIDIDGQPTRTEWFVLALLVLVLPIAVLVGWLVSRISTVRGRSVAATVAVTIAIAGGILGGPSPRVLVDLIFEAIVIAAILALTASRRRLDSGLGRADDDVEPCRSGIAW